MQPLDGLIVHASGVASDLGGQPSPTLEPLP